MPPFQPLTRFTAQQLAELEAAACSLVPPDPQGFNKKAELPYGVTTDHIQSSMKEFVDFLGFINTQLATRQILRLESMLMAANFSSIVGEFMTSAIPKYCLSIVKNTYHNGHPDMVPIGMYPGNSIPHGTEGIEVKGSRYLKGWQGHNPEDAWLMVFCFESGRPTDKSKGIAPKPFRFLTVLGARLTKADWLFSGRSETSRRTITASVLPTGYSKMAANWIYRDPSLTPGTISAILSDDEN